MFAKRAGSLHSTKVVSHHGADPESRVMMSKFQSFGVLVGVLLMLAPSASALDLTDRQLSVSGTLTVSSARKVAGSLMVFDAKAKAPIYLMISAGSGSAQAVMLIADTIRAIKSPVVAVALTEVHGAGAALAALADRTYMLRSSGLIFTELEYEGVKKPAKPPEKPAKAAASASSKPGPKITPTQALLQQAREAYLQRFYGVLAKRLDMSASSLTEKIEAGGLIMSPKQAVKRRVAYGVIRELSYMKLAEKKTELKVTRSTKEVKTLEKP